MTLVVKEFKTHQEAKEFAATVKGFVLPPFYDEYGINCYAVQYQVK